MILQITMFYNSFINFDDVVLNTILNEWLPNYVRFIVDFAEKDTWCEEYLIISTWV